MANFFHHSISNRCSNCALIATMIVLKLIKMAPTAGLKMIPQGAKTPAAKGMAKMLYPVAHIKFWTNLLKVRLERLNIANISFDYCRQVQYPRYPSQYQYLHLLLYRRLLSSVQVHR